MLYKKAAIYFSLIFLWLSAAAHPLKVGVLIDSKPFSWSEKNGVYMGSAVDLFTHIAKDLGWKYVLVPINPIFDEAIDKVHNGELDILVGPISVTHERYQKVDFSRPFFLNSLGVATQKREKTSIFITILKNLQEKIGDIAPYILLYFFVIMASFYFIDNKIPFSWKSKNILSKIGNAFWETLIILIHPQLRDSKHVLRRLILLAWVIPSTIFFSLIVGSVVSTITVLENTKYHMQSLTKEELAGEKLSVLKGNVAMEEGKKLGALMIPVSSREEALELVAKEAVFGTTDDYITLEKSIQSHPNLNIIMSNLNLRNDELAFVFRKKSNLVDAFNQKLLYLQDQGFAADICSRHLGNRGNLCTL